MISCYEFLESCRGNRGGASLHQYMHTHRTHQMPCGIYSFNTSSTHVTGCLQAFLPKWPIPFLPEYKPRELPFWFFGFFSTVNNSPFKYFLKTPFSWIGYWCSLIFYGYRESCHITPSNATTESNCRAEKCPFIKYRPKLQFSVHVGTGRRRTSEQEVA